jgi:hypothetical protein
VKYLRSPHHWKESPLLFVIKNSMRGKQVLVVLLKSAQSFSFHASEGPSFRSSGGMAKAIRRARIS